MTHALSIAIAESIQTMPGLDTEERFAVAVRSAAALIPRAPQVVAALAAAEAIPVGIVLTDGNAAAELVDSIRTIIDGQRELDVRLRDILRIPKAMEAMARLTVKKEADTLEAAKLRGNRAREAYQAELRRRAAEAEAKAREQARKAAEEAAARAAETGDDVPPEAEVAPVVVPRTVVAGSARSGMMTRIKAAEIVDWSAVPKEWLTLLPAVALAVFGSDVLGGKVKKPEPGESVIWQGVRFEAVESAVNRR